MLNEEPLIEKEWVPLHLRDHLSYIHIIAIACGNLSPNLCWCVIPLLFEPISIRLKISNLVQTILLFYGSFAGFAICPILGVYSDNLMFKWGRRRIFMVIGQVFIILSLLLMCFCEEIGEFLKKDNPLPLQQALFIISYVFGVSAGNVSNEPARTICSDVTPLCQQNLMSNLCSAFASIGGILVNLFGGFNVNEYFKLNNEKFALIVSSIIGTASTIVTCIVATEEPLKTKPPRVNPFKEIWNALKNMPRPFMRTILSFYLAQVAYFQFSFGFSHFMGKDVFKGDNTSGDSDMNEKYEKGLSWAMMCGAVRYGAQVIWGFVNTYISEWIGFKITSFISYLVMGICLFLFFFVDNQYAYLPIVFFIGIGYGTALSIPYAIVSMCTPIGDFGANLGIMFMIMVIGEQTSNLGIGSGLSLLWDGDPKYNIGASGVIGLLSAIAALWVVQPSINEESGYFSFSTATESSIGQTRTGFY